MAGMSMIRKIKNHGIVHSLEIVVNRLVPAWLFRFSMGVVYELDLAKLPHSLSESAAKSYAFERVEDPRALQELRVLTWNSVPLETSHGHMGYRVYRPSAPHCPIGGLWGGVGRFNEADLGFEIRLDPDQAWMYCAYLAKEARGEGIYKHLLAFAVQDLQERGYDRPRVIVQPWNKASTYVHRKYSSRTVGSIIAIRILGLATVWSRGGITKSKTWTTALLADPVLIQVS